MNICKGSISKFQPSRCLWYWDAVWKDNFLQFLFSCCCALFSLIAEENPCSLQVFKFPARLSSPCSAGTWECGLVWVISTHFSRRLVFPCYFINVFFFSLLFYFCRSSVSSFLTEVKYLFSTAASLKCNQSFYWIMCSFADRAGLLLFCRFSVIMLFTRLSRCFCTVLHWLKGRPRCSDVQFSLRVLLCSAGTWALWAPRWCATTSPVWWTSSASCAASTRRWCRPSEPGWRTGSQSASTSSATTAGTATPRPETTTCSDACCCAVSDTGGNIYLTLA